MNLLRPVLFGQKNGHGRKKHLASVMGNVGVEVLSTHGVVLLIELASRNAIERLLGEGHMSWVRGLAIDIWRPFQKD